MLAMRLRNEDGGSLVEFALITPLLFLILFGIIEFGVLLYDKAIITNASREGARAGIVFDKEFRNDDTSVNTAAVELEVNRVVDEYFDHNQLISFGSSDYTLEVLIGAAAGDPLTVTVRYPFRFLVFSNLVSLIGGSMEALVNLRAETVMRLE